MFLLSFIITLVILGLAAGLTTADYNTRTISGNNSGGDVVAFSPSNKGIDVKVFNNKFSIDMPQFLITARNKIVEWYNTAKGWVVEYLLEPSYYAEFVKFLKRIFESVVNSLSI